MGKIKNENYIVIQGFMINELKLKGNDLMVYAIIYGFTQDGENWFEGSRQYLAEWCNSTTRGIAKNLESLVVKGLIEKRTVDINNVKFCHYRVVRQSSGVGNKVHTPNEQSSYPPMNKVHTPQEQSSPYNIDNNIDNNIKNNINNVLNKSTHISKKESNAETKKSVIEVSNVQKSKRKSFDEIIERYANGNEKLELLLKQLLQMRFAKKRVTTNAVLNQLLDKLTQFGKTDIGKIKVLENSILKGYPDVYELSKEELEEVRQNELYEMQMERPEEWEEYMEFLKKPISERMEIIKYHPEWRLIDLEAESMNERWGKYHGEETET